jgi:hypothetical protein
MNKHPFLSYCVGNLGTLGYSKYCKRLTSGEMIDLIEEEVDSMGNSGLSGGASMSEESVAQQFVMQLTERVNERVDGEKDEAKRRDHFWVSVRLTQVLELLLYLDKTGHPYAKYAGCLFGLFGQTQMDMEQLFELKRLRGELRKLLKCKHLGEEQIKSS